MGEQNTSAAAVYLDGKPLGAIGELELPEPEPGVTVEQATANCEELAKAINEITAGVMTTINSFCRWIQQVAAEVAAQQEMETALRWASFDTPPF